MATAWPVPTGIRRAATALLLWIGLVALSAAPDHLGWQSVIGWACERWTGRPALIGDSLEWGQDLARLADWVSRHDREGRTWVCVYGQGDGEPYGLDPESVIASSEPWKDATFLAIGANGLFGYSEGQCVAVGGKYAPLAPDLRERLLNCRPSDRVGSSIRIYRVADPETPSGGVATSGHPDVRH